LRNRNLRLPCSRRASSEKDEKPRDRRHAGQSAVAYKSAWPCGALPCPVNADMALLLWIEQLWIEHWIRHT